MVRRIVVLLVILLLGFFWGCDFFIASSFPDYLPSVRNIANLDKYFDKSNPGDYDLFTINDYVFVLYKPQAGTRKVVVLDSSLSVQSEYENTNLGSLHMGYTNVTWNALVGSRFMVFSTLSWDAADANTDLVNEKDNIAFTDQSNNFSLSRTSSNYCQWSEYNSAFSNAPSTGFFDLDSSGEEYTIENATFTDNRTIGVDTDDMVVLYLRRTSDGEGIALGISPNHFPDTVITPALGNYLVFQFGKIKPGSVHIVFGGTGVVMERDDGTVELYELFIETGGTIWHYDKRNKTIGRQFKDRKVAYCPDKPDMYVFDPASKDLFECTSWWEDGF